jgi:hypothetical protein
MAQLNLLIVLIVGTAVGAITGLLIGGLVGDLYLAIIAGILATIIAGIVRNTILTRVGTENDLSAIPMLMIIYSTVAIDRRIPLRVIIYSAVASLAGSASAVQVTTISEFTSSVWIGALAGLFSGILMAILLIVYDMSSSPPGESRSNP